MAFREIKEQERAKTFLERSFMDGRLAGAYLFVGPPGSGKKMAARNLAGLLNCLEPVEHQGLLDACDKCPSCEKIRAGRHPDVHELGPEGKGGTITIEKIRQLREVASLTVYEGKRKVWLLDDAHRMNEEAANCLLKTLEEPPAKAHFILITHIPRRLPSTILSRCQMVRFFALAPETVAGLLREKHQISGQFLQFLAGFSEGGVTKAEDILAAEYFSSLDEKNRLIDRFRAGGDEVSESFSSLPREEISAILDLIISWFRDILVLGLGFPDLIHQDRRADLEKEIEKESMDEAERSIFALLEAKEEINAFANARLALGQAVKKIARMRTDG